MITRSVQRECSPELRELTLKSAALLEELGHRVDHLDKPAGASQFRRRLRAVLGTAGDGAGARIGRRAFGDTFDRGRLDNLTLGLDRHARRNMHRLPLAITRLRRLRRRTARFFGTYDVLLTPTLADETPQIGYLDPPPTTSRSSTGWPTGSRSRRCRTSPGSPRSRCRWPQSATGMPVGMMLSADVGAKRRLLELAYELEEARPWARRSRRLCRLNPVSPAPPASV